MEDTEKEEEKNSLRNIAKTVIYGGLGWAVAQYFGASLLLIPFAGVMIVLILARVTKKGDAPFLNAVAFQFAHLAWLIAGILFTRQYIGLIDVFLFAPFLLWLIARPSKTPAYVLLIINLLTLVYNVFQLVGGTPEIVKPVLAHVLIRVAIIISLIHGLRKIKPTTTLELDPNDATPITPGLELHRRPNNSFQADPDPRERGSGPLNSNR